MSHWLLYRAMKTAISFRACSQILEVEEPEALFFRRADEPLGDAVALRLADEGVRDLHSQPPGFSLEVVGGVLGSPVDSQLQPRGNGSGVPSEVPATPCLTGSRAAKRSPILAT